MHFIWIFNFASRGLYKVFYYFSDFHHFVISNFVICNMSFNLKLLFADF